MAISVGIIGAGKLGSALAQELDNSGFLQFVVSHNSNKLLNLATISPYKILSFDNFKSLESLPDILFLTVQDSRIEQISIDIADNFKQKLANTIIVHCSGTLEVNVLIPASIFAKSIAKLHPYQTFFFSSPRVFKNVAWTAVCDSNTKPILNEVVSILGGKIVFTDDINNFNDEHYHISAIFSANYQAANFAYSSRIAQLSGINPEDFIPKIAETALDNAINGLSIDGVKLALTGPIARGDFHTIQKHISALRLNQIELKGYVLMGLATAEIAFSEKIITENIFMTIKNLFLNEIKNLYLI